VCRRSIGIVAIWEDRRRKGPFKAARLRRCQRSRRLLLAERGAAIAQFDDMSAENRVGGGSRSCMFSCAADCDLGRPISRPRRPTSIGASVVDSQRSSASPDATRGSAARAKGSERHQSAEDQ
jgi:hypothetical protein